MIGRHWLLVLALGLASAEERLVPANLQPRNDGLGMRWDINPSGVVTDGSNDCFDSSMEIFLGGARFNATNARQTADGSELVLSGTWNRIEVLRRIRLDTKRHVLRYAETLTNTGSKAEQIRVQVNSYLGSSCAQAVWSDGKPMGTGSAPMPKGCVGMAGIQQQGSRPSVVWVVGEAKAPCPVEVTNRDQRQFTAEWHLTVPAKGTRVLYHYVTQRPGLTAAQVPDVIKTLWKRTLVKPEAPAEVLRHLANFQGASGEQAEEETEIPRLPAIARLLERAGVTEPDARDLVGVGRSEAERMRGRLTGGPLTVTTAYGPVKLTVDELAGGEGGDPEAIVHLRSGESLVVTKVDGALALETEAGVALPVDPFHLLWMATAPRRSDHTAPADQRGVLELADGTRLGVTDLSATLALITAWGPVEVPLARIARLKRVVEPLPAWQITCDDGSVLRGLPTGSDLRVETRRVGARAVPVGTISGWQLTTAKPIAEEAPEHGGLLANGDRLLGGLAGPALTLVANGSSQDIPVTGITAIERPEEGTGLAIVLKNGGRLVGRPAGGTVAMLAGGVVIRVPTARLQQWKIPPPPEDAPADGLPAVEQANDSKPATAANPEAP